MFAAGPAADEQLLTRADGRIVASLGAYDYPPRALREGLEGRVKVLLGFDRTGVTRSCRPLSSANSSYLANAGCAVLVPKTHFAFTQPSQAFDGLRYLIVPINWTIPHD